MNATWAERSACFPTLIKRCMDDGMPPETTGMQGWIIGFLHRNEDRDMFQRDVEAEFNIRRPRPPAYCS